MSLRGNEGTPRKVREPLAPCVRGARAGAATLARRRPQNQSRLTRPERRRNPHLARLVTAAVTTKPTAQPNGARVVAAAPIPIDEAANPPKPREVAPRHRRRRDQWRTATRLPRVVAAAPIRIDEAGTRAKPKALAPRQRRRRDHSTTANHSARVVAAAPFRIDEADHVAKPRSLAPRQCRRHDHQPT